MAAFDAWGDQGVLWRHTINEAPSLIVSVVTLTDIRDQLSGFDARRVLAELARNPLYKLQPVDEPIALIASNLATSLPLFRRYVGATSIASGALLVTTDLALMNEPPLLAHLVTP